MSDQPTSPAETADVESRRTQRTASGVLTIRNAADFGAAIRQRRKHLGHTQAEAASLCRVGVRFLSELERGKPTAQIGRALKVARRLGLSVNIVARDGEPR